MDKNFKLPLINAHTHAAMLPFRGAAEDLPLKEWLEDYIWPLENEKINPEMVREETKKAIEEMKENKIAYFVDMYFYQKQVARAAIEKDIRTMLGIGLVDESDIEGKNFEDLLADTERLIKKYNEHEQIDVSVAPHSIYTLNKDHLQESKQLARKFEVPLQIHCAETKKEFENCKKEHDKTPVQYLDELNLLDSNTLLAHCVWLTGRDIKTIAKKGANVVHCPLSNAKLGSGIAPMAELLEAGVNVCLGTDGPASSNRLDIWEAGKFAALLQKAKNNDPTLISTNQAVRMMTVNAMEALNIKKLKGKTKKEWSRYIQNNDFAHLYQENFC